MTNSSWLGHQSVRKLWQAGRTGNYSNRINQRKNMSINTNGGTGLFDGHPKIGVGVYDGLSALVAAKWKFDFLWGSSFSCSAAAGLPDGGLIGGGEMLVAARTVRRFTALAGG